MRCSMILGDLYGSHVLDLYGIDIADLHVIQWDLYGCYLSL